MRWPVLLAAVVLSACGGRVETSLAQRLGDAEARWRSSGVTHYSVVSRCDGCEDTIGSLIVEVSPDTVTLVKPAGLGSSPYWDSEPASQPTVEGRFAVLELLAPDPRYQVDATFDWALGFPATVSISEGRMLHVELQLLSLHALP